MTKIDRVGYKPFFKYAKAFGYGYQFGGGWTNEGWRNWYYHTRKVRTWRPSAR